MTPAYRTAAVVAMDRALAGDHRKMAAPDKRAAQTTGQYWAALIQAARRFAGGRL